MIPLIDHLQQLTSKPEHNRPWECKTHSNFSKKQISIIFLGFLFKNKIWNNCPSAISCAPMFFRSLMITIPKVVIDWLTLKLGFHTSKPWRMVPKTVNFQHRRNWCIKCIIINMYFMYVYIHIIYIHYMYVCVYVMSIFFLWISIMFYSK